jgi:hypothetical protein
VRRRFALLLAFVVVLASGCLRGEVDLEVEGDGSGELRVLEAVDESALARLDVESPGDVVLVPSDLPEGVTARPYRRGGFVGTELRTDFADLTQLSERVAVLGDVLAGLADAGDTGSSRLGGFQPALDDLTVARTPTGWYFEAGAVLPDRAELPSAAGASSARLQVKVTVKLPGRAVAHNADRVDGGRFAWNLAPGDQRERLVAETTTLGGTQTPWGLLALGLGLVAVAGAMGWFLLDDRRRPETSPGPGDTARASGGWPSGPPREHGRRPSPRDLTGPAGSPAGPAGAATGPDVTPPPRDAPPAAWPTVPPPGPPVVPGPSPTPGASPPGPAAPPARPVDLPPRPG